MVATFRWLVYYNYIIPEILLAIEISSFSKSDCPLVLGMSQDRVWFLLKSSVLCRLEEVLLFCHM